MVQQLSDVWVLRQPLCGPPSSFHGHVMAAITSSQAALNPGEREFPRRYQQIFL